MNRDDLKIVTWNANGIRERKEEIEVFLHMNRIDICLITETHSTKQTFLKFRGYQIYQTIHPDNDAKGGSAIIIRENIEHYEEHSLQTPEFQLTIVGVSTMKQKFMVGALYCPPRHNLKRNDYALMLKQLGERFILGGDFNAKHIDWGSRLTTTKGRELKAAITQAGCSVFSTGRPTYWPTDSQKIPDLLDFFICKKIAANFVDIDEILDLNSDHSAVVLTLSGTLVRKEARPVLINKKTDWDSFRTDLDKTINLKVPLKTTYQLDMEVERFTIAIQTAAWNNTPLQINQKYGVNYPEEIRNLVKEKRRLRRRWQQSRDPNDKTILNNKSQKLKREIQKLKEKSIEKYLCELTDDKDTNYSLWRATRKTKRSIVHNPPIRRDDGTWIREHKQKADAFADHLAKIFQPNDGPQLEQFMSSNPEEGGFELVSPTELAKEIRTNMSPKKAPGYDLITGEVLKQLPRKALVMLTYLFNAAIRLRHFPDSWKVAEVIMLPKPGKPPNDIKSYRPISLLPIISKLFEKILLKRLKLILAKTKLIPDHQFGFRSQHSTIDQVHRITDLIEKTLEGKQYCSAIFLDVAQAFDKVWHEGLLYKMNKILPRGYTQLLSSYLSGRIFRVRQESEYSDFKEANAGVPQGSVLGPTLYLLYTSDIPTTDDVTIATFADDTAILATGSTAQEATQKLQIAADEIKTWTEKWRIKLNEMKSVHTNFTYRRMDEVEPVNISGIVVPYANTAKYLGMTLDTKLKWKEHVKKKRTELDIKLREMHWLLGRQSKLSIQNKLLIYKQILKPIWIYGIQLWGCASNSHIEVVQKWQNKVLRMIVDAPWYVRNSDLHRDLKIPFVKEEIHRFAVKHEDRLHHHPNIQASSLLDVTHARRRLKRTKPFDLVQ